MEEEPFEATVACPKACANKEKGCTFKARITWDEFKKDVQEKGKNQCYIYFRNLAVELLPPTGTDDPALGDEKSCKPFYFVMNPDEDLIFQFVIEPNAKPILVNTRVLNEQQQKDSQPAAAGTEPEPWDYQCWDKGFKKVPNKTTGTVFRLCTSDDVYLSEFSIRLTATGLCGCKKRKEDSTDSNEASGADVKVGVIEVVEVEVNDPAKPGKKKKQKQEVLKTFERRRRHC